ncbi:hypothetical protein, partial [uncultured Microbacterium sp.]|uniref:hypothetical protein n=1 Tax=uncultured Microbacterium sp. TaxID=191216 RepID=UPI0028D0158F
MTRHVLGIVLAQGLELIARCARQVPRGDFLGDLRSALPSVLGRARCARVLTVEPSGSARTGATVAGRPTVVTGEAARVALTTGATDAATVRAESPVSGTRRTRVVVTTERTITVTRRTRVVVTTERTIPVTRRTSVVVTTERTIAIARRTRVVVTTERTIPLTRRTRVVVTTERTIPLTRRTRLTVTTERTIAIARGPTCAGA